MLNESRAFLDTAAVFDTCAEMGEGAVRADRDFVRRHGDGKGVVLRIAGQPEARRDVLRCHRRPMMPWPSIR